jgi:hypothetical protein
MRSLRLAVDVGGTIGSGLDIVGPDRRGRGLEIALQARSWGDGRDRVGHPHVGGDPAGRRGSGTVAVAGDPLADPRVLADDDNVVLVVKGGQVVTDTR